MKISVLDDYTDAFRQVPDFSRLKDHEVQVFRDSEHDPAKLAARLRDSDAVVLTQERSSFRRAAIEKLPQLKIIAQTGSHRHHIDIAACTELGIVVAAPTPIGTGFSTGELAWGLIISSLRHIPHEVEQLKRGVWQTTIGTGLRGKTLGVYGMGKIGSGVAAVGKAFGMKVMCWGRPESHARMREAGYEVPASRAAFFQNADVISLHIFFNEQTRGIVTAADLAQMKPTALLVNTSRAGLIEEGALVEALKKGRPGFAAVDVYEKEPVIGGNHPLLKLPNALCTPHLGYSVHSAFDNFYRVAIDSLVGYASGKPVNVLNPEALGRR